MPSPLELITEARRAQAVETPASPYQRIQSGVESQFEKDFRNKLAQEQREREQAVKSGLASWIPEVPGFVGDVAVDLPYNIYQRAKGLRGENIKPLGFGEKVRAETGKMLGLYPEASDQVSMAPPPAHEEVTDVLQLANPLAWSALGEPLAIARAGSKAMGAAKPIMKAGAREVGRAIDTAMLEGQGPLAHALAPVMPRRLDVYHGGSKFAPTPENPLGAFDPSKIGTGEGLQFGYGTYLTEAPDVGRGYVTRDMDYEAKLYKLYQQAEKRNDPFSMEILERAMMHKTPSELRTMYPPQAAGLISQIEKIPHAGALYKANLPDELIPRMLDLDKPFMEQPHVIKALEAEGVSKDALNQIAQNIGTSGDALYQYMARRLGGQKQASDYMRRIGIPGNVYLDPSQRDVGLNVRNFVVFPGEEKAVRIKQKLKDGGEVGMDAMRMAVWGKPDHKQFGGVSRAAKKMAGIRKAVDDVSGLPSVVKESGGNWLTGGVEKQLGRMKMADYTPPEQLAEMQQNELDVAKRNNAINKWIDSNLTNYIKKEMGTPKDPVRKLAEQGILHIKPIGDQYEVSSRLMNKRKGVGFNPLGEGKSEAARFWERQADISLEPYPAGSYKHGALDESLLKNNPWLKNVPDEEMIYYAKGLNDLGFDHIIDVLRQDVREGRIRPEQLNKVSMEQAVRRTYEYDQEMARKMAEAQIKATEGMPIHKEYPEGYKWIELAMPEKGEHLLTELDKRIIAQRKDNPVSPDVMDETINQRANEKLAEALKYEGDTMGHCVGGYCPDVAAGRTRIYSLRDARGEPHVTVEVRPEGYRDVYRALPLSERGKINSMVEDWASNIDYRPNPEEIQAKTEQIMSQMGYKPFESIAQIKGKQNAAPKAEYLPYVQDFVRSGQWSDVRDFQNTGLYRKSDFINEFTPEQLNSTGIKEYLTLDEIRKLREGKAWKPIDTDPDLNIDIDNIGMKRGGIVNMDAMRMAVWGKPDHKQVGGISKVAKTAEEARRLLEIAKGTRSKAAQEAAGLYHPIGGGVKMEVPVELMTEKTVVDPNAKMVERRIITPESMQGGVAIPLVGDRAAAGRLLTHIGETELSSPVRLQGGPDFMRTHTFPDQPQKSAAWASGKGVVTSLSNQAKRAAELAKTENVYAPYVAMSPTGVDFNTMVSQALLGQIDPSKISKKTASMFDKEVRALAPDFVGIRDPRLADQLARADAGQIRKAFVDRMALEEFRKSGFPDVAAARKAITDPNLLEAELGSAGYNVAKLDPFGRRVESPTIAHETYPEQLAGEYFGSLQNPIPYRDFWQGFNEKRRTFGNAPSSDWRAFSMSAPIQQLDQEWLDKLMHSMGANKPREWKKGGKVAKKADGGMTSDDLIVEERKL